MYIMLDLPEDKKIKFENQRKAALKLGFNPCSFNQIMTGKRTTKKLTAEAIVKAYNKNAKLENFFREVK